MISSDVNDRARALQRYYVYYKHKLLRFNTFYAACLQVSLIFSRVMERDQWCKIYLTRNVPSYMGIYRVKTDRMNITGSIMLYQNGARSYIFPRIICKFQSSWFFFRTVLKGCFLFFNMFFYLFVQIQQQKHQEKVCPFKVNSETVKTPDRLHVRCSGVFTVTFKHISNPGVGNYIRLIKKHQVG